MIPIINLIEQLRALSRPLRDMQALLDAQPESKPITELPRLLPAPVINITVYVETPE